RTFKFIVFKNFGVGIYHKGFRTQHFRYQKAIRVCLSYYASQNGISEYIANMEQKNNEGRNRVTSWYTDLKMLKHVRWARNQIAHVSGSYPISEPEDLKFVRDFYSRILSGNDPLTQLRKKSESENSVPREQKKRRTIQVQETETVPTEDETYRPVKKKSRAWIGILVGAVVIALAVLIVYFFL
ncbi:MAG: hypothetical protein IJV00_04090, partial [Clostridia bacterium]|nr:hypothetical protein [Clostridia bacterium]